MLELAGTKERELIGGNNVTQKSGKERKSERIRAVKVERLGALIREFGRFHIERDGPDEWSCSLRVSLTDRHNTSGTPMQYHLRIGRYPEGLDAGEWVIRSKHDCAVMVGALRLCDLGERTDVFEVWAEGVWWWNQNGNPKRSDHMEKCLVGLKAATRHRRDT